MKQVKQLCYEQLKHMPVEEVKETIQPETSQDLEADLNSILAELLGKELQQEENRPSSYSRSRSTSVGKEDERKGSDGSETSGGLLMESPPLLKENEPDVREFVIRVSDVSEDEGKGGGGGRRREGMRGKQHCLPDQECAESFSAVLPGRSGRPPQGSVAERVDTEDEIELNAKLSGDQIDRELCETSGERPTPGEADNNKGSQSNSDRESSSVEGDWDLSYPPEVPESARLLEMELRKKALESELKRAGLQQAPQESQDQSRCVSHVGDTREQVMVPERRVEDEISDVDVEGAVDESRELELKLRQRALQSLLAKRKQTELT